MKVSLRIRLLLTAGGIAVVGMLPSLADDSAESKPTTARPVSARVETVVEPADESAEAPKPKPHTLPKSIEEIARMSEAGIASEVLVRYIEGSGIAYEPTGADLIAMKQRGVPAEVMVVMLARSSAIRAEYEAARKKIAAPAIVRTLVTDGHLDPESYEFFWFHHAYPRALAGSYRTLSPQAQSFYFRSSRKGHNGGPKWRTDGFERRSLGLDKSGGGR